MSYPEKKKKVYTVDEAWERITNYCALEDRCQQQVMEKLNRMLSNQDVIEELLVRLIEQRFVDEERYARSYVRGKFKIKRWGRLKIKQGLYYKAISDYCTRKAFEEIDEAAYRDTVMEVLHKKNNILRESDPYKRKQKLMQYLASRGFESQYIYDAIDQLKEELP